MVLVLLVVFVRFVLLQAGCYQQLLSKDRNCMAVLKNLGHKPEVIFLHFGFLLQGAQQAIETVDS